MVVSENCCLKKFVNFQEKHSRESCRLTDANWECSPGKCMKVSEQPSQKKHPQRAASAISSY